MKNITEKIKEVYYNNPALVLFLMGVFTGLFLAFIF
jgi:hypothetical protein